MIRMIITAVAGALVSTLFGYLLLPVLRALKAGQSVRDIGLPGTTARRERP